MAQYSIKDIAKLSGVSTATVSRVINNKGKYSEKTKEKVLKVIKETGFNINSSAQSLRTNTTYTVGILVPDISNYFFSELVQQIEEKLFAQGYSTIICNTARNTNKEKAYLKILETKNVDGIIVISGSSEHGFEFDSRQKNIPYICIDREPRNFSDTIFISSNHRQGAMEATNLLLNSGAKQPVIALPKKVSTASKARLDAFKKVLKENDIAFQKDKNALYLDFSGNYSEDVSKFLLKNPDTDAIFAVNDNIAIQLLQSLKKCGKRIPEDIQLIGFDNIPACTFIEPHLSTVNQDIDKIAKVSVQNIIDCIKEEGNKGSSIMIPTELIQRESTL